MGERGAEQLIQATWKLKACLILEEIVAFIWGVSNDLNLRNGTDSNNAELHQSIRNEQWVELWLVYFLWIFTEEILKWKRYSIKQAVWGTLGLNRLIMFDICQKYVNNDIQEWHILQNQKQSGLTHITAFLRYQAAMFIFMVSIIVCSCHRYGHWSRQVKVIINNYIRRNIH